RLAYLNAEFIAFITDSGGPYGFSLLESFANASYSSTDARRGRACAPGIVPRLCASASTAPTFRYPNAAAIVPTKLRRHTACCTSIAPSVQSHSTRKGLPPDANSRWSTVENH